MDQSINIPNHVGLILDGNRRWAKMNGLPQLEGHRRGFDNLKNICDYALNKGVKFVSAYIFSTENWSRSLEEVDYLMKLAFKIIKKDIKELHKNNIRVKWLGVPDKLDKKILTAIAEAEELTKDNTKGTLCLCFNYGGHVEIAEAVKKIINKGTTADEVTVELISSNLFAPDIPAVDLMIRTSGEQRISNFMLWRMAYSEMLFVSKHWPAFNEQDFDLAIQEYSSRNRRFGGN